MDEKKLTSAHHSNVYDNFLVHWKYIKREKIAGAKKGENKWRYWYKEDDGSDVNDTSSSSVFDKINRGLSTVNLHIETNINAIVDVAKAWVEETIANISETTKEGVQKLAASGEDFVEKILDVGASTGINALNELHDDYWSNRVEKVREPFNKQKADIEAKYSDKMGSDRIAYIADMKEALDAEYTAVTETIADKYKQYHPGWDVEHYVSGRMPEFDKELAECKDAVYSDFNEIYEPYYKEAMLAIGTYNPEMWTKIDFKDLPLKSESATLEEDMASVNPYFASDLTDFTMNCGYCTAAYELRRRGYDVSVIPNDDGTNYDITSKWYEPPPAQFEYDFRDDPEVMFPDISKDVEKVNSTWRKMESEMLGHGEGARGEFCVSWLRGGGHSMAWEIVNGELIIVDAQTNTKRSISDFRDTAVLARYYRTDTLKLDESILKVVRHNRK